MASGISKNKKPTGSSLASLSKKAAKSGKVCKQKFSALSKSLTNTLADQTNTGIQNGTTLPKMGTNIAIIL